MTEASDPGRAGEAAGPLERFLGVFTEVRRGEAPTALLLFLNVFLILCAYYLIKPLREGWIAISEISGLERMEVKAYTSFGQSILLLGAMAVYARLSQHFQRARLVTLSTLFCIVVLAGFWLVQPDFLVPYLPGTGIAFYLWVGIFGVFVVAQLFAFVADVYSDERGRRLIPLVAIGANAGAACGSVISSWVKSGAINPYHFLLLAGLPLLASIGLARVVERRGPIGAGFESKPAATAPLRDSSGAIGVIFRNRYLLLAALITLAVNWVNTNGENLLFRVVQQVLDVQASQGGVVEGELKRTFIQRGTTAFYGNFFFWVNVCALAMQALLASRLLKYGGFGAILLLLPVVSLISYSAMAFLPVLAVVKVMKIAENSTDYSIHNTARHVMWLPLPAELVYKGKATIDSLFARLGDGLAALTVLVGVQALALSTQSFFAFTVALVFVWLVAGVLLVREHRKLTGDPVDG